MSAVATERFSFRCRSPLIQYCSFRQSRCRWCSREKSFRYPKNSPPKGSRAIWQGPSTTSCLFSNDALLIDRWRGLGCPSTNIPTVNTGLLTASINELHVRIVKETSVYVWCVFIPTKIAISRTRRDGRSARNTGLDEYLLVFVDILIISTRDRVSMDFLKKAINAKFPWTDKGSISFFLNPNPTELLH